MAETDEHGNLRLSNEYISISVNQDEYNMGRFAVDVTGGAPMRDTDEGKPLIYGRPNPWPSYTTVRIDGENYVFGGPTNRRAGRDAKYGEVVQPPKLRDGEIITKTRFGSLEVTQILTFAHSSTTGLPDTARIRYRVANLGEEEKEVGLRIMLNTMLGENDGAPFRVEDEAIEGDAMFEKENMPTFFQAFDELEDPKVTAQGTLIGPELTTPDRIYFSNWGSLADGAWDFNFAPGREFLREGEFELDSSAALYWNSETLDPGESREYVTDYGLGGITIVPGLLSLGVTSPSEIVMDRSDRKAQIVAYIQNTADIEVKDAEAFLELPEGIELVSGSENEKIGNLEPGETAQLMWEISPRRLADHQFDYTLRVDASNTDENQVTRSIDVVGPPDLTLNLQAPSNIELKDNQLANKSFIVWSEIRNQGNSPAYDVEASLALSPGLDLNKREQNRKILGSLAPGETIRVPWYISPIIMADGNLPYSIGVRSSNAGSRSKENAIVVPPRKPRVSVKLEEDASKLEPGDYVTARVMIENIVGFYQAGGNLKYNSEVLEPVFTSRGRLFVEQENLLSWNRPEIDREEELIRGISGTLDIPQDVDEGIIARIHFKVKNPGEINLKFDNFRIDGGKRPGLAPLRINGNNSYIGGN